MEQTRIRIEAYCDGWRIYNLSTGKWYGWDHDDEQLGVPQLENLFKDLGFYTEVEDVY